MGSSEYILQDNQRWFWQDAGFWSSVVQQASWRSTSEMIEQMKARRAGRLQAGDRVGSLTTHRMTQTSGITLKAS
jgi:hypothetical protein